MIIGRKYYKIQMFFENAGNENEWFYNNELNKFLEKAEVDSYNAVDFYDFSGEPRRAKIILYFGQNYEKFKFYRNLFRGENTNVSVDALIEDTTPTQQGEGNIITLDSIPNLPEKIKFPAWYNYPNDEHILDIHYPPTLDKGDEITGDYLDYDDIYIKTKSKFLNFYIKIYLVSNEQEVLTDNNLVYIGMIERETVKAFNLNNTIEFELQGGLAILYDALEKYNNFCDFCQSEEDGVPHTNSGITMQSFIRTVLPNLTKYPYKTLFNLNQFGLNSIFYNFTFQIPEYQLSGEESEYKGAFCFYQAWGGQEYLFIVYMYFHTGHSGYEDYEYVIWNGIKLPISVNTETGTISLPETYGELYQYSEENDDSLYPGQLWDMFFNDPNNHYLQYLFGFDVYDTDNESPVYSYPTNYTINGIDISLTVEEVHPLVMRTLVEQENSIIDFDLFNDCLSFNTDMSPLDVVRLACLTTGQYLICDGYNIEFRLINSLINSTTPDYIIDYNHIVKDSLEDFIKITDVYDFSEIENVTLWEDTTEENENNSKHLKPRIKEKLKILLNIENRIKFSFPRKDPNIYTNYEGMKWGNIIKIINNELYENNLYFIYKIDKSKINTIEIESFKIESSKLE